MGARRIRRDQRQQDQKTSRIRNGTKKQAERVRRERLMVELLGKATPPYTPTLVAWISQHLDKPASRITTDDVAGILTAAKESAKS